MIPVTRERGSVCPAAVALGHGMFWFVTTPGGRALERLGSDRYGLGSTRIDSERDGDRSEDGPSRRALVTAPRLRSRRSRRGNETGPEGPGAAGSRSRSRCEPVGPPPPEAGHPPGRAGGAKQNRSGGRHLARVWEVFVRLKNSCSRPLSIKRRTLPSARARSVNLLWPCRRLAASLPQRRSPAPPVRQVCQ